MTSRELRELATLVRLGLPLDAALKRRAERRPASRSDSHPTLPAEFDALDGQALAAALERTASRLDLDEQRAALIRSRLAYPEFLLASFGLVCWVLLAFVAARFGSVLDNLEVQTPAFTRFVLALAQAVGRPQVLAGLVACGVLAHGVWRGAWGWSGVQHRIPILGPWLARQEAAMWLLWMEDQVQQGRPLPDAVGSAARACPPLLRTRLEAAAARVREGSALSAALEGIPDFPRLGVWLVQRAEEKEFPPGSLEAAGRTLLRHCDACWQWVESWLEPLCLVLVAIGAGCVLLAVFAPLVQLLSGLW